MPEVDELTSPFLSIDLSTRAALERRWPATVDRIVGTLPDGSAFRADLGRDGSRPLLQSGGSDYSDRLSEI
jgi:hypothetical protein